MTAQDTRLGEPAPTIPTVVACWFVNGRCPRRRRRKRGRPGSAFHPARSDDALYFSPRRVAGKAEPPDGFADAVDASGFAMYASHPIGA
jgi:hypothetical protein